MDKKTQQGNDTEYALTIPPGTEAEKSLELLKSHAKSTGTVFVHGRGKPPPFFAP